MAPNTTHGVLQDMVGEVGDDELERLRELFAYARSEKALKEVELWGTFRTESDSREERDLPSAGVLARSLATMTGHQMLFAVPKLVGAAKGNAPESLALVLAYYRAHGFSPKPLPQRLTQEQAEIAALAERPADCPERQCVVVGAGPGTGKTSTLIAYAKKAVLRGKRVLLLAYTNSASRTIATRLSADPYLGDKFERNAFSTAKEKKLGSKPILLSTVDMVASAINIGRAGRGVYGATMKSFDDRVIDALCKVRESGNSRDILAPFFEGDQTPLFNDILVDEGQMLDEPRAELIRAVSSKMSYRSINRTNSCHLTVMADPRQSIMERGGGWLRTIFKAESGGVAEFEGVKWQVRALRLSFRFEADAMLEHVMRVSRTRGKLHIELESARPMAPPTTTGPVVKAMRISDFDAVCDEIGRLYERSKSVAILSPTIGRSNSASQQVDALVLGLIARGIPTCVQGEGNFHPLGVNIMTFHSSAGTEFSHVFLVGMSGFPRKYAHITPEVGASLIFVANSRAKRTLTFILDGPELCEGVSKEWVHVVPRPHVARIAASGEQTAFHEGHDDAGTRDRDKVVESEAKDDCDGVDEFGAEDVLEDYSLPKRFVPNYPLAWTAETMFSGEVGSGGALFMATNDVNPKEACVARASTKIGTSLYEAMAAWGRPACLEAADATRKRLSRGILRAEDCVPPSVAHSSGRASFGRGVTCDLTDRPGRPEGIASTLDPSIPTDVAVACDREDFYWFSNMRPQPKEEGAEERAVALKNVALSLLDRLASEWSVGCGRCTPSLGRCDECAASIVPQVQEPYERETREACKFVCAPHYLFYVGSSIIIPEAKVRGADGEESSKPLCKRIGFIVFTSCPWRAMFTGAVAWASKGSKPYILQIDAASGRVYLYDNFHERMGFLLSQLVKVHEYVIASTFRNSFLESAARAKGEEAVVKIRPNSFTIDTEFTNGKDVYEIGILNLYDPYKSIVALVFQSSTPPDRLRIMGIGQSAYEALCTTFEKVYAKLRYEVCIPSGPRPRLYYFSASQDYTWITDPGAVETWPIDVRELALPFVVKRGTFGSTSTGIDLDSLYGMFVGPVAKGDITRHRALPDALMLGDIVIGLEREMLRSTETE